MYLPGVKFAFCSQSGIDLQVGRSTSAAAAFAYQVGEPPSAWSLTAHLLRLYMSNTFFMERALSLGSQTLPGSCFLTKGLNRRKHITHFTYMAG